MEHKYESQKMICNGMALSLASDLRPQGKFHFLKNVRVLADGILQSRPKVDKIYTFNTLVATTPHSIKTIIDKILNKKNTIVGIGTEIYTGDTNASLILSQKVGGFSGDPLAIVDFRPEESTETHAYIADRLKMCKISANDIVSDIGINAPTKALTAKVSKPIRKILDNIIAGNLANWNNLTGSAGAPAIENRINTTILAILYDEATPSFASIVPTAFPSTLQAGAIVILNGADELVVEEIIPSSLLSTAGATIDAISYDVGTSGLCTIVLSLSDVSIRKNSILLLNGTEYVRVLEATRDDNNIPSVRVSTVGTFAIGNTISGASSLRIYTANTYAAGNAIFAEGLTSAIGAAGISSLTRTFDVDLTNAEGKELKGRDILHCSIKVSDPSKLTEIQVQLGAPGFTDNYFYYPIFPNFFQGSASQTDTTLSAIQQSIQRNELYYMQRRDRSRIYDRAGSDEVIRGYVENLYNPLEQNTVSYPEAFGPPTEFVPPESGDTIYTNAQVNLGQDQWTEFYIRLEDLVIVGSNEAITKKDIKAIRLSVNCTAAISVGLDSLWVGGGSDLDSVGLTPYNYIWRVREPSTGVPSNWSPPLREGFHISRLSTDLVPTDANINYPAEYVIDIARHGGTLNDYRIIGTVKNDGSAFIDSVSDLVAASNDPAGRRLVGNQIGTEEVFDFYKPFTFLDTPKMGTCDVIGTKFTRLSGDSLNITYPRGVLILINGKLNSFYTNPTDTNHVELQKDMGELKNVQFEIKTPLLTGQPLPILAGVFGEGNSGLFLFGSGNNLAAGTIYWLDGNSPDTQSDLNFLELSSPSEPVMAIVIYDGYAFAFTSARVFMIIPTFESGGIGFIARENANSRGVFSRWAICSGRDAIYYVTENADGIVKVAGTGNPADITGASINNLFVRNGVAPTSVTLVDGTIIPAPNWNAVEDIRLFYCKDTVVFRFVDTLGNAVALIYDERIKDWISYDTYIQDSINAFYQEELESSSDLLVGVPAGVGRFLGVTNREDTIESMVIPFSQDSENSRVLKRYDEIVFDMTNGTKPTDYTVIYDNGDVLDPVETITGGITYTRKKIAKVLADGLGRLARNITAKIEWDLNPLFKLFEIQFYFIPRSDQINDRASDLEDAGVFKDKFFQGIIIEADTFGLDKTLNFLDDSGNLKATIVINHTGKETKSYSFPNPFIAHSVIQTSDDGVEWINYRSEYKFDLEPELGKVWETQESSHGIPGYKVIERIAIVARTTAVATLNIYYDDIVESYSLENTAGDKRKQIFFVRARKGKLLKYRIESNTEFRIYQNDLEVWLRQYNTPNSYQPIQPFGDKDYLVGAQI